MDILKCGFQMKSIKLMDLKKTDIKKRTIMKIRHFIKILMAKIIIKPMESKFKIHLINNYSYYRVTNYLSLECQFKSVKDNHGRKKKFPTKITITNQEGLIVLDTFIYNPE